ncbi:MAG: ribonuclease III [Candidatus Pacebacteria bacterium]|nr:ribonuclease III [Candidatus Paceibacterota bacterium]
MMTDFEKFAEKINIKFNNINLLQRAFTHRSYLNENKGPDLKHNERLEFLGDAVLELVTTHHLFTKFPDEAEGVLTAYRSAIVNTTSLLRVAEELEVNNYLLLSKGEAKDEGRARNFIVANVIEAIIGAVYLDQGYDSAAKFIDTYFLKITDDVVKQSLWQDSKSSFQEKAQEFEKTTPTYKTVSETGPDHDKKFKIEVLLKGKTVAVGEGVSKQEAEQEAARKGLGAKQWI